MKQRTEAIIIGLFCMAIILTIAVINRIYTNDYTMYDVETISYDKAKVVEIISENLQASSDYDNTMLGTQQLLVEFTSGEEKGQQVEVKNSLSSSHNVAVTAGTSIIVKSDRPENVAAYYSVYNYDRTGGLLAVGAIFVAAMIFVGRIKGLKSVIGLAMSMTCILGFLIPAIFRGWSPVAMTIITVLVISSLSLVLLNGFREKTYVAILSTMIGVILATIFFFLLQQMLCLSGYNLEEADTLIIIARSTGLKIKELFFCAVLISSLGAVIDTTMSIAAALYEIRELNPEKSKQELFQSGVTIGQDMIGTMCQTLILAFVGSAIASLLVMVSYGTQLNQFLSSDYVALEVVQAISGSMAIIFAVPVTAFLCTINHQQTKLSKKKK